MRARSTPLEILASLLLVGAVVLAPGCSSDSPSEPSPPAPQPPGGGGGTFNITVTANPGTLETDSDTPVTIGVQVRRADNGQPPASGTTAVVSTTLGSLGSPGGDASAVLSLVNGNATVTLFPPADPGTAVVTAQLQSSGGQAVVEFVEPDAFFLSFVDPGVGTPQGGDTVTINGSGFDEPVRVTFDDTNAQVLSVSPNQIRAVTPPSPGAGNEQSTVNVAVTINLNEEGQASDTLSGGFTYSPGGNTEVPAVFSVTPGSGPNEGGTLVVIVGEGFVAPVQVIFGLGGSPSSFQGQEAEIRSVTSNRIEVLSPAATGIGSELQNQQVDVLVRNLSSGLATIQSSSFRYGTDVQVTALSTNTGDYRGGELVTIFGQGFDAPVSVEFGGVLQEVRSVTGTEIVVRTVAVDVDNCTVVNGSGPVTVTNIETGDSDTGPTFQFVITEPLITGLSVTSGPEGGNTPLTISGAGFDPPTRVLFGGAAGTITSEGSTSISVRTPRYTGAFPTQPCQVGDPPENGTRLVPVGVDVTVINLLTDCQDTFPDAFTYNPANSACQVEGGGGGGGGP